MEGVNSNSSSPRPSILVVEDEPLVRMFLVDALQDAGFKVMEAATGDEGLAVLEEGVTLTAVITDVEMPGKTDGFALARISHELYPNAAILVFSGRAFPAKHMLPPGARFLDKPVSLSKLVSTVSEMIEQAGRNL